MPNLVVCCDGTWNTPDEAKDGKPTPTNVAQLRNALVEDDDQRVYYHSGVGTGKGWWDRVVGGGAGQGLDENTKSAYAWLGKTYRPGDHIYLFGFSRGAYTARCCAGLVARFGLLDLSDVGTDVAYERVGQLFDFYRSRDRDRDDPFPNTDGYPFHNQRGGPSQDGTTLIFFIGVWDTVGALGIPDDFALLGLLDNPNTYRFYDTRLSPSVAHARHALAIDERRASFAPTIWSHAADQDVEQLWFPGVHSDVGGGYPDTDLSHGALKWMTDEAALSPAKGWGLRYHDGTLDQQRPDALGALHDSATGIFGFLKSRPRSVPFLEPNCPDLHDSTKQRLRTPSLTHGPYWAATKLALGEAKTVEVFAQNRWNSTGLYLEAGAAYVFGATGEWIDGDDKFSPAGGNSSFRFGNIARFASSALGRLEPLYQSISGEHNADFWYTRRVETSPWFALMGFVANDVPREGAAPEDLPIGETFEIGKGTSFKPTRGGYLYCFANDTWQTYKNNRGSVTLTVSR